MAKDYKNTPKRKGKTAKPVSGWLWMLAGLSIGLFVALLVYIKDYSPDSRSGTRSENRPAPVVEKGRPAETEQKLVDSKQGNNNKAQKPRFDFYNLLPEMEVFIPDQEIAAEREKNSDGKQVVYYLQVGSFRQFDDADRLRAQLALINMESHIQRVTINAASSNEQTWHRVRVGPFSSARKVDKVRNQLRDQSMDPIVLKTVLKAKK